MSAAERQLLFTSRAERDIRSALLYTQRTWGARQRSVYRRKLNDAFSLIRDNPEIGLSRVDLGRAVRSRLVERHVIYYEILPDAILVLRLVHVGMVPPSGPGELGGK